MNARSECLVSLGRGGRTDDDYAFYVDAVDIVAAQCYTHAGNPVQPRYRNSAGVTLTATEAGIRSSSAVAAGIARAKRLAPTLSTEADLWALLCPVQCHTYGRNPTYDELALEVRSAVDGGATGILYFEQWMDGGRTGPSAREALLADPVQLDIVTRINAEIQQYVR